MRAAFFDAAHSVAVRDTREPEPAPGEVLVRVAACGICGTDQHIYQGDFMSTYPLIGGHEIAGEVAAVGSGVDEFSAGDRVAIDPGLFCGHCFFCQRGQGNHCLNFGAIGVTRAGGFAEYVVAPRANIYAIGDLPYEHAAFIEPVSCVVHGLKRLQIPIGASALIYGAGPIGLLMMQLVRHAGAAEVAIVDTVPSKLELAARLGAHHALAAPNADEALHDASPLGFDVVIDCTGVPKVVEHMFTHVRNEGKVLFFGVNPQEATIAVSPYDIYRREITIYGSFALRYTFHEALAFIANGVLDIDSLISDRFPIDGFPEALERAGSGRAFKVQIQPGL
jgi:2-desacetyl-2-hydroxyethyl bacteriochlorophyllide A dehydrogenase